jgi:hypothetical protein
MKKTFALLAVSAAFAMAALPAAASATTGYAGVPAGTVQTTIQNTAPAAKTTSSARPTPTAASTPSKGTLPFTGLQVGLVAAAGLALVGTGLGLRRLGHSRS